MWHLATTHRSLSRLFVVFLVGVSFIGPSLQVTTGDAYRVLSNPDDGGCDDRSNVPQLLSEAVGLSQAALTAIETAQQNPSLSILTGSKRKDRKRILNTLESFFGVESSGNLLRVTNTDVLSEVHTTFKAIVDFAKTGSKDWRFACNDKWLKVAEETLPNDPENKEKGEPIPIQDTIRFQHTSWVWVDKDYPGLEGGWYVDPTKFKPPGTKEGLCSQNPREGAFVMRTNKVLTICPNTFGTIPAADGKPERKLYQTVPPSTTSNVDTSGGGFLDGYFSVSSLLVHEMSHQLSATTDDVGYGFENCQKGRTNGKTNADSYALFALAMWLGNYDWSTGAARTPS
ncbi:MAG: hypothetical protein M4579_004974 [Chaenotheca gracillima]|nr:MAG: hypothetical protein M4579_004974 [Chaenotheca gracillima]